MPNYIDKDGNIIPLFFKGQKGDKGEKGDNGNIVQQEAIDNINSQLADITKKVVVSITDFGAKGDGVADDIISIQNAIDYVTGKGGGLVYIPSGTYIISSAIKLKNKVSLKGDSANSSFIQTKTNTINAIECVAGISWSEISHLNIKSDTKGTGTSALLFDLANGGTQNKIHDLVITNFENGLNCGDVWYSNSVDNIRIWYATNSLRLFYNSLGASIQNEISNIYVHQPTGYGLNINGYRRLTLTNINIDTTSFPTGIFINTNSHVSIRGFNIEGSNLVSGQVALDIRSGSNVYLENGQITPKTITGYGYGIKVAGDNSNLTVVNCNIEVMSNLNQIYTENALNCNIVNLSPKINDVYNANGLTASGNVNNINSYKTIVSPVIDFQSTSEINFILAIPSQDMRIKSVKLCYTEYVSSQAGIPVVVKWGTGSQYVISSITNEVSVGKYTFTNGTLTNTLVRKGVPLIVNCAGGRLGTGKGQIVIEYASE